MDRKKLLNKLLNMNEPVEWLNFELAKFGWDSKEDLVLLKKQQLLRVLNKFLGGKISHLEVEEWAEAIECREDIDFEVEHKELITQIIFDLANPDVAGTLSESRAKILIAKLNERKLG